MKVIMVDRMMYPYDLGWHIKAQRFCRIPKDRVPVGTVRIKKYKGRRTMFSINPYDDYGVLKPEYWSIHRWIDFDRMGWS